jgi:ribose transport system substrate-binding protein
MGHRRSGPLMLAVMVAFGVIAMACGGSSGGSGSSAKPAFLVTYPGIDPAEEQLKIGGLKAGQELGVDVVWRTPQTFDVAQQLDVTESALTYPNLKGVAVVAADPNGLEGAMTKAKGQGLALAQGAGCADNTTAPICFDTHPPALGATAAKYMCPLMNSTGDVVIGQGTLGDVNNASRQHGFEDYMKANCPNIHVVQVLYGCDHPENTVSCAQNALSRFPNLAGYYANGDGVAVGATVFTKAGKHVVVGSLDVSPVTLQYVKDGTIAFTLMQPLQCMGYLLVYSNYLQAVQHKKPTVRYVDLGSTYLDQKNVDQQQAAQQATCSQLNAKWKNEVFK